MAELGQLVQEEDPAVGQGKLAGAGPADPAAGEAGLADRVVRRPKRALSDDRALLLEPPGD